MKHREPETRFFKRTSDGKLLRKLGDGQYLEVKGNTKSASSNLRSTLARLIGND